MHFPRILANLCMIWLAYIRWQPEELIQGLQDLENAASTDAAIREKIAALPPEVSDPALLENLKGTSAAFFTWWELKADTSVAVGCETKEVEWQENTVSAAWLQCKSTVNHLIFVAIKGCDFFSFRLFVAGNFCGFWILDVYIYWIYIYNIIFLRQNEFANLMPLANLVKLLCSQKKVIYSSWDVAYNKPWITALNPCDSLHWCPPHLWKADNQVDRFFPML